MPDAVQRDEDIAALLARAQHREAFELLVARYEAKIYRLCLSLVREHALAEDAAQESIVRIWKSLASFDARAALSTWIYTITRNRCLSALDKRRSLSGREEPWPEDLDVAGDTAPPDDRDVLLRRLVDALPERFARCVTLYYYEERSVTETASMLGVPEGTVKTHLSRGRALLQERLQALGLTDAAFWLEETA